MAKRVALPEAASAWSTISASRLLAPMTLVGRTALSVDMRTKFGTDRASASRAIVRVPNTLTLIPSPGLCSTSGTCLRSEEHTSELQSLMRISYAVFCLKKKKHKYTAKDRQLTHK